MKDKFEKTNITDIVDNITQSGKMLNYYNHMKNLNAGESYAVVYPNHKEEFNPILDIDVNKEVEILANKFRILSTPGVEA